MRRWMICTRCKEVPEDGICACDRLPCAGKRHIEVVPLSEVREALLADDAVDAARIGSGVRGRLTAENGRAALAAAFDAAFPSTDSEEPK